MYKRPCNVQTSSLNRYENIAGRSRGGGTLYPEKHENDHISVENCRTVTIQVSADSEFGNSAINSENIEFNACRSNGFRVNGCQSWNIWSEVHFSNGSQSSNIDRSNLAEKHI